MKNPVLFILFLICTQISAWADDCIFVPDKTVCGVSIKSSRKQFLHKLGEPDGKISMGKNKIGYFYGQRILIIFEKEELWEIDGWEINPNIDFWNYVSNHPNRDSMKLVFTEWNPWGLTRKDVEVHENEFPLIDADGFTEFRKAGKSSLAIFYDPFYSAKSDQRCEDAGTYQVNRITISFHETRTE